MGHGVWSMGLAIVRHLVELHGGTVSAESLGEGQGATFTVRLPLLKDKGKRLKDENNSLHLAPHSPLLTAYAGEINQQQALLAGFQKHLSKPVEPDELVKAITNILGRD